MIPEHKQAAVALAIKTAFGVDQATDIRPLTAGLTTALVFRIVALDQPYLLKIIMNATGARVPGGGDPTHQFACLKLAAQAGIAPHVRYASVEDGILITDFIEPKPLPADMVPLITPVLRTLHSLPKFPRPMMPWEMVVDGFVRRLEDAHILPDHETAELFRQYWRLSAVYPRTDAELVASHNDLKPQNMLFDGSRILLIDWEAAFLNDRYTDLALVANFLVKDEAGEACEAMEKRYLHAYFGEPAGDYRNARFYLRRQALHIFSAALLLMMAAKKGLRAKSHETPDFADFHRRLSSGEADLANDETKLQYGMVHLREAVRNVQTPRFEAALARVAAGQLRSLQQALICAGASA